MPNDDPQWVIDAAKAGTRSVDSYHLVDPATGNGLSVAFCEDTVDVAAVKAAIENRASEIGRNNVPRPRPGIRNDLPSAPEYVSPALAPA